MKLVRWLAVLTLVIGLRAFAEDSTNLYLFEAKALYQGLDYERALARLTQAAAWKGNTTQDEVEISLYSGLCNYNLGEKENASRYFVKALKRNRRVRLPPGTSPRIVSEFRALRAKRPPLTKEELAAQSDAPLAAPSQVALNPKQGTDLSLVPAPEEPERSHLPSILVGSAAVASAGVATYFAVEAKSFEAKANGNVSTTTYAQAQSYGATARRDARNANIGFAVAGGLAIGALVTFLTGH